MSQDGATFCAVCHELIITREDGSWIHTTQYVHDHPATADAEASDG